MITDIQNGEYGIEGRVRFDLFDTEIDVAIDEETDIEYAQKCAEALNSLSEETILNIWKASKNYCLELFEMCDGFSDEIISEITDDTPPENIKKYIYPSMLIIDEPEDDRIGFHIECNCEWEPEHGLELTFLDGKLIYAGLFNDCGAWDEYDEDDNMNFANLL